MVSIILGTIGLLASIISIAVGVLALMEWRVSRAIERAASFPLDIGRAISFTDYVRALNRYEKLLRERRAHPEVVVGIHYGGIASAADVARRFYGMLLRVVVKFEENQHEPRCVSVQMDFDAERVAGRTVLLVDNRIKSGRTLEMARDVLISNGATNVKTLVIFKPAGAIGRADDVLFVGKRRLKHLLK